MADGLTRAAFTANKRWRIMKTALIDSETTYAPMFDYHLVAAAKGIPFDVLTTIEEEARTEFPQDSMMMELHVLRAVKTYG